VLRPAPAIAVEAEVTAEEEVEPEVIARSLPRRKQSRRDDRMPS